jgi:hypothetical protein
VLAEDYPPWLQRHSRQSYIVQAYRAIPDWVDREQLKELKCKADRLTKETGIQHVLGHVIPLNHPKVCGLTVPWNLEVITWHRNLSLNNRCCFGVECEQLELTV